LRCQPRPQPSRILISGTPSERTVATGIAFAGADMTNPPPNAPAAIIAAIIVLRSIGILLYLPFGAAMKPTGEGFPSTHQELLPLKAEVMAPSKDRIRLTGLTANAAKD